MRIPDLEAEIEENARMLQYTCKNCGCTWSKHKTRRWTTSLLCPVVPGPDGIYFGTYFRSMVD